MKTSNKLLIGTGICVILAIISHTFIMRGAYLDAIKNPVSDEVNIGLKKVKYLNLTCNDFVNFRKGAKYEIHINKMFKDSLNIQYQGDTLNLDTKQLRVTIIVPELPVLIINQKKSRHEDAQVRIDSTFQSGNITVTFVKRGVMNLYNCKFDKVSIKGMNSADILMEKVSIKQCNIDLKNNSTLNILYSNIQSKNIVLGDSSTFNLVGKQTQSMFLK